MAQEAGDGSGMSDKLTALRQDALDLADQLVALAQTDVSDLAGVMTNTSFPDDLANIARGQLHRRRLRKELLPNVLFADPAWDILLDLFIAHHEGQQLDVSGLCAASLSAATTTMRHLTKLQEQGLIERGRDPKDRRRVHIWLAAAAETAIASYLVAISQMPDGQVSPSGRPALHNLAEPRAEPLQPLAANDKHLY